MGKTSKKAEAPDFSAMPMAAAMAAVNPVGMSAWKQVMDESSRFVSERFEQDVELQKAMMGCTSPQELFELQSEFYNKAVKDYTAEATRMFEMMTKATQDTMKEATATHARKYDDVPL